MATSPLFGWEEPDDTDLVKDGAAAIRTLGNAIDTSMGDLLGGSTGQVLSKASNANMDFTWVAQDDSNAIQNSLVDAKGDLIAASANDTPARLAVGANGETLVADSSTSTGLRYQGSMAAGRNFVINGGMDIWQRGTSKLDGANGYHTADRWLLSSATAVTFSRQSVSDSTNLPFVQYCMRVQRTSGSTSTSGGNISQSFETVNSIPLAGKTVTLSFYARKGADYSAASSVLRATMYTGTGTDQNVYTAGYTGSVTAIDQNATLTTTWQRFSFTATLAGSATEIGLTLIGAYTGTASTNDYYEVTGIQLEVGSVATQFSRAGATIQGELAACQRYYYRQGGLNTYQTFGGGFADQTTTAIIQVPLPATMRVAPTSVDFSTLNLSTGGTNTAVTSLTILSNNSGNGIAVVYPVVASGLTANRPYSLTANNSTSGYLGLSAEL
jgi:hypothetical protein